jgi:hypothetical protein
VSPFEAFTLAGSSMLTLGFLHPPTDGGVLLAITAAGLGLVVLALFITYLPSLYGGFQRRERGVSKLEVRAGQPASGVYLIALAWAVGQLENLRALWAEWEDWFTDVDESHSSFPALAFFRSTHPDQSWITAAGAILDGASLFASTVDTPRQPEPEFMIRAGYLCLRHLAAFFNIAVDDDPQPRRPDLGHPRGVRRGGRTAVRSRRAAETGPGPMLARLRRVEGELRPRARRACPAHDGADGTLVVRSIRGRAFRPPRIPVAQEGRQVDCPLLPPDPGGNHA